jgi:hypothetical protein
LNDAMIIGTVLVPYLLSWLFGGLAALNLRCYSRQADDLRVRTAFGRVALGLGSIILISVLVQVLVLTTSVLGKLALAPLLGIIYVLIILYGLGYVLIARGSKQLRQLAEPG